jgi:hypothetical protein
MIMKKLSGTIKQSIKTEVGDSILTPDSVMCSPASVYNKEYHRAAPFIVVSG